MPRGLFLAIEQAETCQDEVEDYRDAIQQLSSHQAATCALLDALIHSAITAETFWREIEQRDDYKARYTSRVKAREDYLHEYFSRH